jgi:hypothetical protein
MELEPKYTAKDGLDSFGGFIAGKMLISDISTSEGKFEMFCGKFLQFIIDNSYSGGEKLPFAFCFLYIH